VTENHEALKDCIHRATTAVLAGDPVVHEDVAVLVKAAIAHYDAITDRAAQ
jgi:hypothetical protein